ncbi:MAG: hypothetical protein QXD77_01155 [Candidatus Aenigmatarchaeota archaeon]
MSEKSERLVREAAAALGTEPDQLTAAIIKFEKETEELEKKIADMEKEFS